MTLIGGGINSESIRYAGVDLKTLGLYWEIIDGLESSPPVRGNNLLIPYQQGMRWSQKYYDQRHVVLNGTMLSTVSRNDYQSKVDQLKALFPIASGEQRLEAQFQDGTYRYVLAEISNTLGLQRQLFPTRAGVFSIELVASDPFWYSTALQGSAWAFDANEMIFDDGIHFFDQGLVRLTTSPYPVDAANDGNTYNRKPLLYLTGTLINPVIQNLRNGYSVQVTFNGATAMIIDCGAQTVTANGVALASSLVTVGTGQVDWMRIEAGANSLQVSGAAGAAFEAFYSPAYL